MIAIRVTLPDRERTRLLRVIDPRRVRFAEREALNATAAAVQRVAIKEIAEEMGVTPAALRKRGRGVNQRATRGPVGSLPVKKASSLALHAVLTGYGRPFNLARYGAREIKGGARSSIKGRRTRKGKGRVIGVIHSAWGRSQTAVGAWRLGKGNRGPVVVASSGAGKRGGIRGAFGPGVTHVMQYPKIRKELEGAALREFGPRFNERLQYAFSSRSHVR